MLQKVSEQVGECLRRAAEADARAEVSDDAKNKTDYQLIADTWRTLARSHEFQGSLGRFVSFNKERQNAVPSIPANNPQTLLPAEQENKPDVLDWLARVSERIRPYSGRSCRYSLTVCRRLGIRGFALRNISSRHIGHRFACRYAGCYWRDNRVNSHHILGVHAALF